MARGPSITALLVEHLGLAESDLNGARSDIGTFLKQRVDIHYALDHEIAGVAELYMVSTGASRYFTGDALNYRWSSEMGRAEIEKTVRDVMIVQQAYAIEQLHRGHGVCPGCRYDPLPSQRARQPQPGIQQQPATSAASPLRTPVATNVASSPQSRPRRTDSHEEGGNHIDDALPFPTNTAAIEVDDSSDSDYVVPPRPRKRRRASPVSEITSHGTPQQANRGQSSGLDNDTISVKHTSLPSRTPTSATPSSSSSLGVGTNHGLPAAQGSPSIVTNFRGKTWSFRSRKHQAEVLAAVSTWQAEEINRVLEETSASRVVYLTRALQYEREIEDVLTRSGAESADS